MMDSSHGLSRSLHHPAEASGCGFAVVSAAIPIADSVRAVASGGEEALELATTVGEDFELVFTVDEAALEAVQADCPVEVSVLGEVTDAGVTLDGEPLVDEGWTHE
jgi:thiamine-monophosphate kinase